ncbi:glycosyltransferase family 8 protein [Guptibacillus sedimenti]|uniref:glycosyltransferase family 8 protein n=1 Tax=Guptibacillus sedimenti TaxID=3025680 RepID=UPI00235DC6F8|nr:glycosyltransferase family 8 protein [Pseudalkalibacillus sedimenti]
MKISVVYSSDNNYAQHVGVSILSVFENNQEFENIDVYLIENNISTINKHKLQTICEKYNRKIHFVSFTQYEEKLTLKMKHSISINAYARLFISEIIDSSVNKVLYLDCDSIVNGNLTELWSTDISNYHAAGVLDTVSEETKLRVNVNAKSPYINSGMLLINLAKWRGEAINKKFIDFIESYNGDVFHHDQGVINGVLSEKILILHPKYNAMTPFFTLKRSQITNYYGIEEFYSEAELIEARTSPVFIHFTPAFLTRPWVKGSKHPLASNYKKYLEMTPWNGVRFIDDNRNINEKFVSFLFNKLPFKVAISLSSIIYK